MEAADELLLECVAAHWDARMHVWVSISYPVLLRRMLLADDAIGYTPLIPQPTRLQVVQRFTGPVVNVQGTHPGTGSGQWGAHGRSDTHAVPARMA